VIGTFIAPILEVAANTTQTASTSTPSDLASPSPILANSSSLSGIIPAIQNVATIFAANVRVVTVALDNVTVDIGAAIAIFLVILGVILWFSRIQRRLGKELVAGGIMIGAFIEFVVPYLVSIHF